MIKNKFGRNIKLISLIGIMTMLLPTMYIVATTYERYEQNYMQIEEGEVHVSELEDFLYKPAILNGEWITFGNIYIENEFELNDRLQDTPYYKYRELPEVDLRHVSSARTYKLKIYGEFTTEELDYLSIGIPLANDDIRVYFNGNQIEKYEPISSWLGGSLNTQMYLIEDAYNREAEYQELIISVPTTRMSGLYRRQISISRVNTYLQQMSIIDAVQTFMCGLMVLSVLLGFIYMAIHPSYSVLTFMNLYDACKMFYILLLISDLPMVIYNSFVPGEYGESYIRGLGIAFFFLAALFVNQLSQVTFDPNKKVSDFFLKILNGMWLLGALFYGCNPQYFTNVAITITMIIFVLTLVGNFLRVRVCYFEGNLDYYAKFVLLKTMILGSIVFLDLVTMNTYPRNNALLVSLYSVFFVLHFFVRGFMYRKPYDKLERYNEELALAVENRTIELQRANEDLKKLATRDALTGIYNRLYFEGKLDDLLESKMKSIHLCIFDLDDFKSINDNYGHQAGDEQLKDIVEVTKIILPEEVIVSRIGGEEFTLLFVDYENEDALVLIEKLRQELAKRAILKERTTGSFGLTKLLKGDNRKSLFVRADECLYMAKENGKNRIEYKFE